jgi:hypothetical protein
MKCATGSGGGWWFPDNKTCQESNLNGVEVFVGVKFYNTTMMVRRK